MAKRKVYRYPVYLFCRALAAAISLLPRRWAFAFVRFGSRCSFYLIGREREKTREHLRQAYGTAKTEREIYQLSRAVFENLALTPLEVLHCLKFGSAKAIPIVNAAEAFEVYDRLLGEGKGLISITAHLGNWELLAAVFGLRGYPGAVLARRIQYEPFNRWVVGIRAALKVPTLYRDRTGREVLKRLAQNEIIGMLPDQDLRGAKGGLYVDFFGRPAFTSAAPVKLSLLSGAPILCNYLVREKDGRFRIALGEIIRPRVDGNKEEAVLEYTKRWMHEFEKMIRKYPEQWAWMHDRWQTKPEDLKARRKEVVGQL